MPKLPKPHRDPCSVCGRRVIIIDLYCRVSEDYDGDGGDRSVNDQEEDGQEFVGRQGCCHRVGQVFKDPDRSAWQKNSVRPDFNECMARLAAGESDGVWVPDITRFSRKPEEGHHLIAAADRGQRLYSSSQARDLTRADDRKWFRDRLADAENESMRLSERVSRGKRLKATRRGQPNTSIRSFGSAGWKFDGSGPESDEVVSAEREAVRHVARMVLSGHTNADCVRFLNDGGFRSVRGNEFNHNTFRQMMTRKSLAGFVTYKDAIVEGRDLPEPWVLDRDTFAAVQAVLAGRSVGPAPRRHLLTNLMHCGVCGRPMSGAVRKQFEGTPSGRVYKCNGDWIKARRACGKTAISADFADEVVEAAVIARLSDARHRKVVVQLGAEGAERRTEIDAEIAEAVATDVALAEKLGKGRMRKAAYDQFVADNDARIARLEEERAEIPEVLVPTVAVEEAERMWVEAAGDLAVRRHMVREAFPNLALLPAPKAGEGKYKLNRTRIALDGVAGSPARVNTQV